MVVSGSAVRVVVVSLVLVAVLVALVADLTVAAVDAVREVALDQVGIVEQVLPVLGVAHHVGSVTAGAVPVLPAVKGILIPAVLFIRAVHEMSAILSCGSRRPTVVVTFVTDGSLPTVGVLLEVAAVEDEVVDLRLPSVGVVWADQVFPHALVAVPVLSTVVRVREISIAQLSAIRNSSTVRGGGCGRRCWLGGAHGRVVARSGPAVNIFSVGTPIKLGVVNPRQSVSKGFALLVGNCSLDTVIVEGAGL